MWSNYVLNICVYTHQLVLYAILARGAFLHSEQQLKQTKLIEVLRMGVECLGSLYITTITTPGLGLSQKEGGQSARGQ